MVNWNPGSPKRSRGFTLIELMTVVAIVALLATIAVASYRSYLIRANRTDATSALLRIQIAQEKFFLQNNSYATNGQVTTAPPAGLGVALGAGGLTPGGHYTIAITNPSATEYTATATVTAGQAQDVTACHEFSINHQGARTPAPSSGCWR